jgi:CheY-like chemotaxis protein
LSGVRRVKTHFMLSTQEATLKPTILVVDDSPDMQRYLRMVLELDCYRVETANNGVEALQLVRNGAVPEVVVLDLQMPGLDGMKTLGRLLKLQPELKVIMCSGVDDPAQVQQAALLGARAYLKKPVQHLYLSAAVKECLGVAPDDGNRTNGGELISLPPVPRYSEN